MAITQAQAIDVLRGAFAPLVSGVSTSDFFGDTIRMRIVDRDNRQILTIDNIDQDSYADPQALRSFIIQLRADIADRFEEIKLAPWDLPDNVTGAA